MAPGSRQHVRYGLRPEARELALFIWSSVLSTLVALIAWLYTYKAGTSDFNQILKGSEATPSIAWMIVSVNIIPNYLSLLKTRFALRLMALSSSVLVVGLLVLGDAVLSALTPVVGLYFAEQHAIKPALDDFSKIQKLSAEQFGALIGLVFRAQHLSLETKAAMIRALLH